MRMQLDKQPNNIERYSSFVLYRGYECKEKSKEIAQQYDLQGLTDVTV